MTTLASPLISVVMPCYNAAAYVGAAIESVMGQSYGQVELVVVDDGSSDGSQTAVAELKARYPGRIHTLFTHRAGPYPARNAGLKAISGEFVAFLDADDWWLPETLEKLHLALTQNQADIAYCGWQNVGAGITAEPYIPPAYEEGDAVAAFLRSCPWPIHAALVRREVVTAINGFSERRFSSMDYDFWLRALAHTRRITRVAEVMAFYRWHGQGQVSAVKWRQVLDAQEAQLAFVAANPALVAHIEPATIKDLTDGQVLRQAYRAYWKRDLISAQKLFRHIAARFAFAPADLRHIALALLPPPVYRGLFRLFDRT